MQAVILAAGYGLRLRPLTESSPKGLAPILGKPLLEWTLEGLPKSINEIIIVTGWLGEQIKKTFGASYNGLPIHYLAQEPINGTGSALHRAEELLRNTFLVINGDDVYNASDLQRLSNSKSWALLGTKTTKPLPGAIVLDQEEHITGLAIDNSPANKWQVCGAYLTDTSFFDLPLVEIPVRDKIEYSLPHTLLQSPKDHTVSLIKATSWLPIGTPEELAKAEKILDNI